MDAARGRPSGTAILAIARKAGLFVLLAAMIVGFWLAEPAFLHLNNLFSVLQAVAVVAILGVGVTLTLAVDALDRRSAVLRPAVMAELRHGGGSSTPIDDPAGAADGAFIGL